MVHDLEHVLFLVTALLFWWPAVGLDPAPWRMPHPGRAMYVFLQMPQNTFLAVMILFARAAALPALRDAGPAVGSVAARRPAARRRGDVARRRLPLHRRDHRDRRRLDAATRSATRPRADRQAATPSEVAIRAREVVLAERLADQQERAGELSAG